MSGSPSRVLVTSAASSPGIDLCRSLRQDPTLEVVGADSAASGRLMAGQLCHRMVELPLAADDGAAYADALERACRGMDFLFIALDVEIESLVRAGHVPTCPNAVPFDCAAVLLDKNATTAALPPSVVPKTEQVADVADLARALEHLRPPVWLRPVTGTSGQGSLRANDPQEGRFWMDFWQRRGVEGAWMVQEYLPGRNLNWTGLFRDGELLGAASMERLEYFLGKVSMSGVTGQVSSCETVSVPEAARVAQDAVRTLSAHASGLFSVDLRENAAGLPRITEVNPRPAGRPWLYTLAGANLPLAAFRALTGRDMGDAIRPEGARIGLQLHRQLDIEPVVTGPLV